MRLLRSFAPASALLAVGMLQGCAGSVASYPSLAPRPIEREASAAAVAAAADSLPAAVAARVTGLAAQARDGDAAFATAAQAGCAALDRGIAAAEGGEAWVAAQQALSAIEAARAPTIAALDALDTLVLEQAGLAQGRPRGMDLSPLLGTAADVATLDAAQHKRLEALRTTGCRG